MDKFFNGLPYFGNSSGSGHSVENTGNTNNLSNIPAGKITGLALCTSPASVFTMSNISPTGNESVVSNTSNDTKLTEPAFGTTSTFQIGPTMSSTLGQGQGYTLYGASTPFNSCTTSIQTPSLGSAQPPFQHTSTAASGFASGSSSVFSFRPSTVSSTKLPTAHESVVSTTSNGTNSTLGVSTAPLFGTSTTLFNGTTSSLGVSIAPALGTIPSFAPSTTTSSPFVSTAPAFGTIPSFGTSTIFPIGSTMSPTFGVSAPFSGFGVASPMSINMPSFSTSTSYPIGSTTSSTFGVSAQFSGFGTTSPVMTNTPISPLFAPEFGATTSPAPLFGPAQSFYQYTPTTTARTNLLGRRYTPTVAEREGSSCGGCACNLISISAMPAYENKSHEELRWEDCQRQLHKGIGTSSTPTPSFNFGQHASTTGIGTSSTPTPSFNFGQHASTTGIGTSSAPTPSFSFVQHASTTGAPNFAGQNGHGASVFGATAGTSNASLTFGLPPCISTNTCCLHSPGSFPPASIHAFGPGGATHAHATNEAWRQSSIPSAHSNIMGMPVPLVGYGQNSFPGIMLILHPVVYNGQTTTSFSVLPLSAFSSSMANFSHSSAGGSKGQAVSFC
ncbi:nuclear pore complex protein NUP98B isoform X1 [Ziziphus jujuba]|uniref:Nuclear pore complex protein NUP98B isoform X1 n=1 Tax=Ziziphus jujuba TaxID=326968 RepID=A0ABM3IC93_ZIZJJ|nr:nuclear pore complex protein NUP98B isoform X1 [Ziziphus jujuba]XP_048325418.1 nuclear pore complex protein NUP98B isoform X1 [Ziziphus jujuba]